jgi:predicted ATPase
MAVKSIRAANFKSFADLSIDFGSFNVIVGSNAAGKSNFVSIIRFLKDCIAYDLDDAISLQGGVKYLRNIILGASKPLSIEFVADRKKEIYLSYKEAATWLKVQPESAAHKIVLSFNKRRSSEYEVAESLLTITGNMALYRDSGDHFSRHKDLGPGDYRTQFLNGKLLNEVRLTKSSENIEAVFPYVPQQNDRKALVYETLPGHFSAGSEFREVGIYDFDPKLSKKATAITSRPELNEDGSNLALILKSVTEDSTKNKTFSNLIKSLLPFIGQLGVDTLSDKSLLFKVQESYFGKHFLPASLISDGTISIAALILALYFSGKSTIILEEPERNIHPFLISAVVEMMKDAARTRQVIVTTHNPEIVKHAGLANLFLVTRDRAGFSRLTRPAEREEVKIFLQNELGLDEVYAQNLLDF